MITEKLVNLVNKNLTNPIKSNHLNGKKLLLIDIQMKYQVSFDIFTFAINKK